MTKSPCAACLALTSKPTNRHDPAHPKLREVRHGPDVGHMFGGGSETDYVCDDCGSKLTHSSDRTETGWR